jgi:hypothetical protein
MHNQAKAWMGKLTDDDPEKLRVSSMNLPASIRRSTGLHTSKLKKDIKSLWSNKREKPSRLYDPLAGHKQHVSTPSAGERKKPFKHGRSIC